MNRDVLVIGAGPAGVAAAWELSRRGAQVAVVERSSYVGGIARTERWNVAGRTCLCDIGGHRFFTRIDQIQRIWEQVLGNDFLDRQRSSRIFYDGQFFRYPIEPREVLTKLGWRRSLAILASFFAARLSPRRPERSFEDWVVNRFGRCLFEVFFKSYTEKVWGMPCHELSADWAAQRIRSMSILTVLRQAVSRRPQARSLITHFRYPRYGSGQMWEEMLRLATQHGCKVHLSTAAVRLVRAGTQVQAIHLAESDTSHTCQAAHIISTMPLRDLVLSIQPPPPPDVVQAARALRYRALIEVVLLLEQASPFPDQWIYVHSPQVKLARIQNYRNWSPFMVPFDNATVLGMEYFAWPGDDLWRMRDDQLIDLAIREGQAIGLVAPDSVKAGRVVRVPHAYPVYDPGYTERVSTIRAFLAEIQNLQTIGRAGLHRYNNMDHSMLTGLLAARNILGEEHDVWQVNEDEAYLEEAPGRPAQSP